MQEKEYKALKKAVIRTPLFPLTWLKATNKILSSNYFLEGLFLSSPLVSNLYEKGKMSAKMKDTLHKYAHRSAFRCTPYGLFAGNSVAYIDANKSRVVLKDISMYNQCLSLDIACMRNLIDLLKHDKYIRNNINYYTNESIYLIHDKYHYVENLRINGTEKYNHSTVDRTEIIDSILLKAKRGISISDAVIAIKNFDSTITDFEARSFIDEMIDAQLLKSDLEIDILGGNPLNCLIKKLKTIGENIISSQLVIVDELLKTNHQICSNSFQYITSQIIKILENIGLTCEPKNLICVDLYKPVQSAIISLDVINNLEKLLALLVRIQPAITNNRIRDFVEVFEKKYEDSDMELTQVLDNEYGIGYPINHGESDDESELLNDLVFPYQHSEEKHTSYNKVDSILFNKLFYCIKNNENTVFINDSDFAGIDYKGSFPPTVFVLCSVLKNNQIFIKSIGGISAANIVSRFATNNEDINAIVSEIVNLEQKYAQDDILLTEIANIPDYNDGNIVCKANARTYAIPYISNYSDSESVIPISDLTISVHDGKIILKSKSLNKRIVPRFTSSYNYERSQLPIIRFLYDLQCANITDSLSCQWHDILNGFDYLPRIQYNNCILSKQRWILRKDAIKHYFEKNDDEWYILINQYIEARGIPKEIVAIELDNELYINIREKEDCVLLRSIFRKTANLIVEEYIYSLNESIVESNGEQYANETVLFFKQNESK